MAAPWQVLASVETLDGVLELRRRRDDWLMLIDGRVLMNSFARASEEQLATLAIARFGAKPPRQVLVSGLGMAFTLRAVLDGTPAETRVVVAELNPVVVDWCKGPLAPATDHAIGDPRVRVEVGDVAAVIAAAAAGAFDLILLDLYEGPNRATQEAEDPCYGPRALARTHRALAPRGVLGVWSEDADATFARRFSGAHFDVTTHSIGRGGRRHVVYLGSRR